MKNYVQVRRFCISRITRRKVTSFVAIALVPSTSSKKTCQFQPRLLLHEPHDVIQLVLFDLCHMLAEMVRHVIWQCRLAKWIEVAKKCWRITSSISLLMVLLPLMTITVFCAKFGVSWPKGPIRPMFVGPAKITNARNLLHHLEVLHFLSMETPHCYGHKHHCITILQFKIYSVIQVANSFSKLKSEKQIPTI